MPRSRSPRTFAHWIAVPAAAALCAPLVALSGAPPAAAGAKRQAVEQQIASTRAKLDHLNNQAEAAAERYNAARIRLADAQQRSRSVSRVLAKANAALSTQQTRIEAFARQSYMTGGAEMWTGVLAGTSPADLIDRESALGAITQSQQQTLTQYAATRRAQQAAQVQATAILAQVRSAAQQALQEKQTVMRNAAQAQHLLTRLRAKQATLIREAKARRARRAAEARAAALAAEQRRAAQAARSFSQQPLSPPTPAPVHHYSGNAVQVAIQAARAQLGKPYVYGAAGPNSFDCSGLTMYAYAQAGIALPHYTNAQYAMGRHVSESQLQPGDLVFFNTDAPLGHVGMYLGGGQFIQAPHTGDVVKISALSGYYQQAYAGATRIVG